MNEEIEKQVVSYISGELSGESLADFEALMKKDVKVKELVDYYRLMGLALEYYEDEEMETDESRKNKEALSKVLGENTPKRKNGWIYLTLTLAILLFSLITVYFLSKKPAPREVVPNKEIENLIEDENENSNQDTIEETTPPKDKKTKTEDKGKKEKENPQKQVKIFVYLPSNEDILTDAVSSFSVMGSNWKADLQNGNYERALDKLNSKYINGKPADEIEDIHYYYAGLLSIYHKGEPELGRKRLQAVTGKKYKNLSLLHLYISFIKEGKEKEALLFYQNNKTVLDSFAKNNKYNISKTINKLTD